MAFSPLCPSRFTAATLFLHISGFIFNFFNKPGNLHRAILNSKAMNHYSFFLYGGVLLLIIHFLVHFGCPSLLRWSNSVPTATNLARYPNLHSFGLSHDYGLPCTLLISNQTPPIFGACYSYKIRTYQQVFNSTFPIL